MADRTQAALEATVAYARRRMRREVDLLMAAPEGEEREGAIDRFGEGMLALLTTAHTRAAYLGRYRAGDTSLPDADDAGFADAVIRDEDGFLAAFEESLRAGRYTDLRFGLLATPIIMRAQAYLNRIRGTANEAWALTAEGMIRWELDEAAEHCGDCLRHAASGPYTWQSLPAVPRDGSTACITGCRCVLVNEDGSRSFE